MFELKKFNNEQIRKISDYFFDLSKALIISNIGLSAFYQNSILKGIVALITIIIALVCFKIAVELLAQISNE